MSEQKQIIEQLTKTLELLSVQSKAKSEKSVSLKENSNVGKSTVEPNRSLEEYSKAYIDFTYENPTTYHVIDYASKQFEKAGFEYLSEKENWVTKVTKGSKFYTIRNGTNLSAFIVGKNWTMEKGVGVIGSHADALAAKLKPSSKKDQVEGFELLGVAPYGGTLNDLWFDRDLGIGGRVLYKDSDNQIKSKLINSAPHPIARIPTLAPHFGAPAVGPFDKEDQAVPIVSYASSDSESKITDDEKKSPLGEKHDIGVLRYIANLAGVKVEQLVQLDLDLFDVQKGVIGGIKNDFLIAPRLDDRLCTFAAISALIEYSDSVDIDEMDTFIDVTLFDNEEIGSLSRQGAKGGLLESVVSRVSSAYAECEQDIDLRTLYANSIILSADVNHMFNPNFSNVYMKNHSPKPNVGITLSLDPNVHMSTDVVGTAFVEELARLNDDKVQYFQIKNNSRSGGTIGPSISSQTGARAIDLGIAQLAMHSIRAATGSKDIGLGVKFFKNFLKNWKPVYDQFGDL